MSRKNWKLLLGLLVASLLIGALLIVAISPRLTEPFVIATQPAMEGTVTPLPDGEETPEEAEPTEPLSGGLPPYGVGGGSPIGTPTVKADQPPGESLDKLTEQALQKLTKGTVVYNNPDSMRVGEPEQIQALLVRSTGPEIVEVLEKVVVESAGGTPLSETIRMSQLMQVRLVPQDPRDFRIVPLHTEEVQPVGPDDATSWSWVVTPLRSGERRVLYLKATAMIEIPGEPLRSKDLPTQTIAIPVDVNPTYSVQIFLMRYGWVLAVLLLAGLGAVALRKGYLARFFKPGEPSKEIPVPHDYAQLEIRILKREPEGYPVEMTCGGRQFPRGYIRADILDWHPTLSSCEDGERLFEAFVRDDRLKVV